MKKPGVQKHLHHGRGASLNTPAKSFTTRWVAVGFCVLMLGSHLRLWAESGAGGAAGALFKLGMDARALGLGNAYTAVVQDAGAGYWNPAALALATRPEARISYTRFPVGGDYTQLGMVLPLNAFQFSQTETPAGLNPASWGGWAFG